MREFTYYITDKTGNSYQVENGMVVAIGNYKPMEHAPLSWQDMLISWERSESKYGIARNFSLPLGFVIDGLSILSYLNWSNNFEQQVNLLINRRTLYIDTNQYYFYYKYFYKGELDFSTYEYDNESSKAQIAIMEGGLSKLLKAGEATMREIPFTDDDILVKLDGIILHKAVTYEIPAEIEVDNVNSHDVAVPTATIGVDGAAAGVALFDQQYEANFGLPEYYETSQNFLLAVEETFSSTVDVNIVGQLVMRCTQGGSSSDEARYRLYFNKRDIDGNVSIIADQLTTGLIISPFTVTEAEEVQPAI